MASNKYTIVNAKPLYIDPFLGLGEALRGAPGRRRW
jgi:hypothetical protein